MSLTTAVNDYYTTNAKTLCERYLTMDPAILYADLLPILDDPNTRVITNILDIGGGVGRDAMFFSQRYTASIAVVEPVAALRNKMIDHLVAQDYNQTPAHAFHDALWLSKDGAAILLCDDALPDLQVITAAVETLHMDKFDFINVNAVWQHIPKLKRHVAAQTIIALLADNGVLSVKGHTQPSPEQQGVAWAVTAAELSHQFAPLKQLMVEKQPDHNRPNSTLTFTAAVFQKQ